MEFITDMFPWFSVTAFNIGWTAIVVWWFIGLTIGWCFDVIRKS